MENVVPKPIGFAAPWAMLGLAWLLSEDRQRIRCEGEPSCEAQMLPHSLRSGLKATQQDKWVWVRHKT
jgi:uncharacterized protein (TIGR03382 family)